MDYIDISIVKLGADQVAQVIADGPVSRRKAVLTCIRVISVWQGCEGSVRLPTPRNPNSSPGGEGDEAVSNLYLVRSPGQCFGFVVSN